jgi:hypothetical protein
MRRPRTARLLSHLVNPAILAFRVWFSSPHFSPGFVARRRRRAWILGERPRAPQAYSTVRRGARGSATQPTCPYPPPQQEAGEKRGLRVRATTSSHLGAMAGWADARRGGADDVVTSSGSGNAADARPPPRPGGLRLPGPQAFVRRSLGFPRLMGHRSHSIMSGGLEARGKM